MKLKINKKNKVVVFVFLLVIISAVFFILEKENKIKYYEYVVGQEDDKDAEEIKKSLKNLDRYKEIRKEPFFGAHGRYYILEKTQDHTIILINSGYDYKKVKSIKKTDSGLEIELKEKQYKRKNISGPGGIYYSSSEMIIKIEGKHNISKIFSNARKENLKEIE